MIQYDTRIEGQAKKKELPFRCLVFGDFSQGKSKDRQLEFEDRNVRVIKNGIDATLKDMDIGIDITVPNSINPQRSPMLDIHYKFNKMADFQPDKLAKQVPQLNALLKLKEMLISFEKDIDNDRALKKTIDRIFSDKDMLLQLKGQLPKLDCYRLNSIDNDTLLEDKEDHG